MQASPLRRFKTDMQVTKGAQIPTPPLTSSTEAQSSEAAYPPLVMVQVLLTTGQSSRAKSFEFQLKAYTETVRAPLFK